MDVIVERPAALDVHKAQVTACVRAADEGGRRVARVEQFKTTVRGLLVLRDWLKAHGVTQVAMEATGVYSEADLPRAGGRLRARARQRPSREAGAGPQDRRLGRRLALSAGRGGAAQSELRTAPADPCAAPAHPLAARRRSASASVRPIACTRRPEDTGVKLDCVATNVLGVSGRAMPGALLAGTTDPEVLADLARGRLRAKLPALREALEGRFDARHALLVGAILAHLDFHGPADRTPLAGDRRGARPPRRGRLSCCAASPASSAAAPRTSSPRSVST